MHPFALCDGDHPREYGENRIPYGDVIMRPGPSPRIRGELFNGLASAAETGTIPANTGRIDE